MGRKICKTKSYNLRENSVNLRRTYLIYRIKNSTFKSPTMSGINYSKWNNIEISDDEDDTHPNIDTPSLFKWRHEARVKRMEEIEAKKKAAHEEKLKKEQEVEALKKKMASTALSESEMAIIKKGLSELEREAKDASVREKEVMNEEKKMPLNVDTISKPGFSKSIINKNMPRTNEHLTEEERETKMRDFVTKYEKELKAFTCLKSLTWHAKKQLTF